MTLRTLIFLLLTILLCLLTLLPYSDSQRNRSRSERRIKTWCRNLSSRPGWTECQEKLAEWCKKKGSRRRRKLCKSLSEVNPSLLPPDEESTTTASPRRNRRRCSQANRRKGLCGNSTAKRDASFSTPSPDTRGDNKGKGKRTSQEKANRKAAKQERREERKARRVEKSKLKRMRERMSRIAFKRQKKNDRQSRRKLRKLRRRNKDAKRQISEQTINNPDDYWEGDVDLSEAQAEEIERILLEDDDGARRRKRKVGQTPIYKRWDTMPISFQFGSLPDATKTKVREAIQLWEDNTCVRFQEDGPNTDRLEFYNGPGCSSYVGRVGGTQEVSIHTPGCDWIGIISHEIGHALGFFHEQARPDRDKFVSINFANVDFWYQNNFAIAPAKDVSDWGLPYDYGSVMHYDAYSFAMDSSLPTIQSVDAGYEATMGQRAGPSFIDFAQVNQAYCSNTCANQLSCENGGYTDPNDCSKCKCPGGLGGTTCDEVEYSDCGDQLEAWREADAEFISSPGFPGGARNRECNWLLKTSPGSTVTLEFEGKIDFDCKDVCDENYVEIKSAADFKHTGRRYCCTDHPAKVTSAGDRMVVRFVTNTRYSGNFKAKYWTDDSSRVKPTGSLTTRPTPKTAPPTTPRRTTTTQEPTTRGTTPWWMRGRSTTAGKRTDRNGCTCEEWTMWTPCTQSCGGCGQQTRSRQCDKAECYDKGEKKCGFPPCEGKSWLWNNSEFHILLDDCCIGMFKNNKGECGGLSSAFSEIFSSLVPTLDKIRIPIRGGG